MSWPDADAHSVDLMEMEIDASRRGIGLFNEAGVRVTRSGSEGTEHVFTTAATTYIAAAVTAVL